MKKLAFALLLAAAVVLTSCSSGKMLERDVFAMDTFMTLRVYGADEALLDAAENEIGRLESLFSATRESDISRLNSEGSAEVSPETAELVSGALEYCELTGGALDISVYPLVSLWGFTTGNYQIPDSGEISERLELVDYTKIKVDGSRITLGEGMSIDLGAVAKGYTGDRLCELLRQGGVTSAVLNLGGNVQTIGSKPDGSDWRVAIKDPFKPDENLLIVGVSDSAVITSGDYERYFVGDDGKRYCHIIDPSTGRPADSGIASITIIGKNGLKCDSLSTALFVSGAERAISLWRESEDFEMVIVTTDKKILITDGVDVLSDLSGLDAEVISRE